jgi:hypothetical protein
MRRLSVALTRTFMISGLLAGAQALAHHAGTMFDRTNPIAVVGTLQEFRWANPHSWLSMQVPDGKGGSDLWTLEGGSVTFMIHNGWDRTSILPGDKIRAIVAPRRDGTNGGEFMSVTNLRTGKTYQQNGHF